MDCIINRINMLIGENDGAGSTTADVANFEKPIGGEKSSIEKRNNKWVHVVDDVEIDSDDDLEVLKKRIGKVTK